MADRPILARLRRRFPVIARVGAVIKRVAIGEPPPVDPTTGDPIEPPRSFLAFIRKAIAGAVAAAIAWLLGKTGINLGFVSEEATELLVSLVVGFYLVWRVPNASVPR